MPVENASISRALPQQLSVCVSQKFAGLFDVHVSHESTPAIVYT